MRNPLLSVLLLLGFFSVSQVVFAEEPLPTTYNGKLLEYKSPEQTGGAHVIFCDDNQAVNCWTHVPGKEIKLHNPDGTSTIIR